MSHAVVFDAVGGPEVLKVADVDVPEPGTGEVRVRVLCIGVNRPDLLFRAGLYPVKPTLPQSRLGIEALAVIESRGPGVTGLNVGDRVLVGPVVQQSEHGVYGEHVVVPAAQTVLAFEGADDLVTTASWMAYFTAYAGLVTSGGLQAGDPVLITAASSAVGLAAIDVARHLGAVPIAATRSSAKEEALRDAGARHVVVGRDQLGDRVRAVTDGRGAALVFDATGGPEFPSTADAVAEDGTIVVYGWYDERPAVLPTRWPMNIVGHTNFTTTQDPARLAQARNFVAAGVRSGAFVPRIDRVFHGLDQAAAAHRYAAEGGQFGKVLIALD
ncbi:zinc-dependent alcohol dehydrogenase family protein [Streptomyces kunmingensis]|uniref:Zinc-dependent alcohol dehydrogenase family protein n=1 Tax=Streptomyces kunmingensis TaxID=68225 RepID=A0ABU6CK67_9ACTN|nr:zinc-dependent alcohol dehydrogenase family protein [Streptomyces kunmingensis]MEB3965111.1 zinc-dependent alcohol dehydrogenase family protein [Streptomyces kunmingensis]